MVRKAQPEPFHSLKETSDMPESSKLSPIQIHKQRICSQAQLGEEDQALPAEGAPLSKEDLVGVVCTCFKYLHEMRACAELQESLAADSEAYRSSGDSVKDALSTQTCDALEAARSNLLSLTTSAFSDLVACLRQVEKLSMREQLDEFGFYFRPCKLKDMAASEFSSLHAVFDSVMNFEYDNAEILYDNFCWNLCRFYESK